MFFIDECHLLWGDICGYVWGQTNQRINLPILNQKERQTYFGAINYFSKEFVVREYSAGNGENTVSFLKELQNLSGDKRIAVFWDGASYHKSQEVKKFLASVNEGLEPSQWQIYCGKLAPNAPEQNPVEDIWLQGKNFLRKFWQLCKSFEAVKWLFSFVLNFETFDFPKLQNFLPCCDLK